MMDIWAVDGKFMVGAMRLGGWESKWNEDGTLEFWAVGDDDKAYLRSINVQTNSGTFVECIDAKGNVIDEGGDGKWFYLQAVKEPRRLRFKALPEPKLSKADLDKARQVVRRYLISDRPYNCDLPGSLTGVIEWMQAKLAEIPEGSRDDAAFTFDTTMEYGETYPNIEITFREPETDEEVLRRLKIEAERSRVQRIEKKAQLDRLKAELEVD